MRVAGKTEGKNFKNHDVIHDCDLCNKLGQKIAGYRKNNFQNFTYLFYFFYLKTCSLREYFQSFPTDEVKFARYAE